MPGMYGGVHDDRNVLRHLHRSFVASVPGATAMESDSASLGGHSHGDRPATARFATDRGNVLASVDGDAGLYHGFNSLIQGQPQRFRDAEDILQHLQSFGTGNIALVRTWPPHSVSIHTDWSGAFPLYFVGSSAGVLFSSLLRPIASCMASRKPDLVGVAEYLREGHTYNGRTVFRGVTRLLPGQILHYDGDTGIKVEEGSQAWNRIDAHLGTPEQAAEACWERLRESVDRNADVGPAALMMSAGWDSRTLLYLENAAAKGHLLAYSHGDSQSREIAIAQRLSGSLGVDFKARDLGRHIYQPDLIDDAFRKTESLVFLHWHDSGRYLAQEGVRRASSGVLGEVLGGHYGHTMLASGSQKVAALLQTLWRRSTEEQRTKRPSDVADYVRLSALPPPWYASRAFANALRGHGLDAINADIEADLSRLAARGVTRDEQLVEAFISEHRGSHYINAQALSLRAYLDISLPFAARDVLRTASWIPPQVKVHNRVNRAMLKRYWRNGLKQPTAAILVSAGAPLLIQEASRVARKVGETLVSTANTLTKGAIPTPRLGWVNFEFLRTRGVLEPLLEGLTHPVWDQDRIRRQIEDLQSSSGEFRAHPVFDQLGKMMTVQRWLE